MTFFTSSRASSFASFSLLQVTDALPYDACQVLPNIDIAPLVSLAKETCLNWYASRRDLTVHFYT
jgi:hypothetical protein